MSYIYLQQAITFYFDFYKKKNRQNNIKISKFYNYFNHNLFNKALNCVKLL